MSPVASPIAQDVLSGFRAGDERALERLFRERYLALTDDARTQLGAESAGPAPKVVERAFVRAWEERSRFETPEALDAFLKDCIHEGVVRERSRLAALHRFDHHEGGRNGGQRAQHARAIEPIPLDDAWKHVHAMLHPPAHSAEVRHRALDESRHHAAEHLARTAQRRPLGLPLAIAGIVGVLVLGGLWWIDRSSQEAAVSAALSSSEARIIGSGAGQIGSTTLSDGSIAKVGPDTKLTVSPTYGTTLRALKLEGAGSFQVAPGKVEPFAVRVREHTIYATGTKFDVTAYPADPGVAIRVREGAVRVKVDGGDPQELAAGRTVRITDGGEVQPLSGAALDEAMSWVDGKFTIVNRPLREALPLMTRWYKIDLRVPDSALLSRPVNVSASLESSREAIAGLEKSANLKFDYEDKNMVLRDAGAAKP